jgi:hypothetical protein
MNVKNVQGDWGKARTGAKAKVQSPKSTGRLEGATRRCLRLHFVTARQRKCTKISIVPLNSHQPECGLRNPECRGIGGTARMCHVSFSGSGQELRKLR